MLARRPDGKRSLSSVVYRFVPLGVFSGLGAFSLFGAVTADVSFLWPALFGAGAAFAGNRVLDRAGNFRRRLRRAAGSNVESLRSVARFDRVAAPQMERMVSLQGGLLESWEMVSEDHREILDEDILTVLAEIEDAAKLARRRAAMRRHLATFDRAENPIKDAKRVVRNVLKGEDFDWRAGRGEVQGRIESLEREVESLPEGSALRATFENALAGRREELEGFRDMRNGISLINAQLEHAESLLASLRGDLLTLDMNRSPGVSGSDLARLKERVSLFKRSLDEVAFAVDLGSYDEPKNQRTMEPPTGNLRMR